MNKPAENKTILVDKNKDNIIDEKELSDMISEIDKNYKDTIEIYTLEVQKLSKNVEFQTTLNQLFDETLQQIKEPRSHKDKLIILTYQKINFGLETTNEEEDIKNLDTKTEIFKRISHDYKDYIIGKDIIQNSKGDTENFSKYINIKGTELEKTEKIINENFKQYLFSIDELYNLALIGEVGLLGYIQSFDNYNKKELYKARPLRNLIELNNIIPQLEGKHKRETLNEQLITIKEFGITNSGKYRQITKTICPLTPEEIRKHLETQKDKISEHSQLKDFFLPGVKIEETDEYLTILQGKKIYRREDSDLSRINNLTTSKQEFAQIIELFFNTKYNKLGLDYNLEYMDFGYYTKEQIIKILDEVTTYGFELETTDLYQKTLKKYLNEMEKNLEILRPVKQEKEQTKKERDFLKNSGLLESSYTGTRNYYQELFCETDGSHDLFIFLENNPQKLTNLGGKIIKELDLNVQDGSQGIHRFRGVLEMIKSRDDIDLPTSLTANPTEEEKYKRENERQQIVKEYESVIRNKIKLDFKQNSEENIETPKDETFDQIFFCGAVQDYSNPNNDGNFSGGEDRNGAFKEIDNFKNKLSEFTKTGNFQNFSSEYVTNSKKQKILDQSNPKKLLETVYNYHLNNPDKKVLVYISLHGSSSGSAGAIPKDHFRELANISPNIKIISDRCYFGKAYDNTVNDGPDEIKDESDYIYNLKSPVSGFSNKHVGYAKNYLLEGFEKGLGFHEAEIYSRTKYISTFAPMTEELEYQDRKTKEIKKGINGLTDTTNYKKVSNKS